jgi:hypothetical protein
VRDQISHPYNITGKVTVIKVKGEKGKAIPVTGCGGP